MIEYRTRPLFLTRAACLAALLAMAGCSDGEDTASTEHLDPIDLGWIRQAEGQIRSVDRGTHRLDFDRDPFAPPGTTTITPTTKRRPNARRTDILLQGVVVFGERELAILNNTFTELGGVVEQNGQVWTVTAIDAENVIVTLEHREDDGTVTTKQLVQETE